MSLQSILRASVRRLQATPRCITCYRARTSTRRLISGRSAYACEECVEAAVNADGLSVRRRKGRCIFCDVPKVSLVAMSNYTCGACDECLARAHDVLTHA